MSDLVRRIGKKSREREREREEIKMRNGDFQREGGRERGSVSQSIISVHKYLSRLANNC